MRAGDKKGRTLLGRGVGGSWQRRFKRLISTCPSKSAKREAELRQTAESFFGRSAGQTGAAARCAISQQMSSRVINCVGVGRCSFQ